MGIHAEIFDDFFRKLEEDKTVSKSIINDLRELVANGEISSKEKILAVIDKIHEDGCED